MVPRGWVSLGVIPRRWVSQIQSRVVPRGWVSLGVVPRGWVSQVQEWYHMDGLVRFKSGTTWMG